MKGEGGSQLLFLQRKRNGGRTSYHCMGVPRTFGRHCRLPIRWFLLKKIVFHLIKLCHTIYALEQEALCAHLACFVVLTRGTHFIVEARRQLNWMGGADVEVKLRDGERLYVTNLLQ